MSSHTVDAAHGGRNPSTGTLALATDDVSVTTRPAPVPTRAEQVQALADELARYAPRYVTEHRDWLELKPVDARELAREVLDALAADGLTLARRAGA